MFSASSASATTDAAVRAGIDRSLRHPVMFFLTCGAGWLALSIVLAIVASAKLHSPAFLDGFSFTTYGRVFPAHIATLVWGWGFQTGFAALIWLVARLTRKPCTHAVAILSAGHLWNLAVLLGVVSILGGAGTGMPWMEFPRFVWSVLLLCFIVILVWSFIQVRVREAGPVPVALWYLLAVICWFPWLSVTAHTLLHCTTGHPVMAAGINAWFKSGLIFLFFVPVALGGLHYLVPKLTGRAVPSSGLAQVGFWTLAAAAPWAGMQKLAGAPIPVFLPYVGAAATALMVIPLLSSAVSLLRAAFSADEKLVLSPPVKFALAGLVAAIVLGIVAVLFNLPGSALWKVQFSLAGYGFDMLALYGLFGFVSFAMIYFMVPRLTNREWVFPRLINMHFFFTVYGVGAITVGALIGGYIHGSAAEAWLQPWGFVVDTVRPYAAVATFAWCMILFANVFFFIHLLVMWLGIEGLGAPAGAPDEPTAPAAAPTH